MAQRPRALAAAADTRHNQRAMRAFAIALSCCACLLGAASLQAAPQTHVQAKPSSRQAATQDKLTVVKQRIAALAREQRATAGKRDAVNTQLATQTDQLSAAAKAVHASNAAVAASQQKLDALEQQRATLKAKLAVQRNALADLLRAAYKIQPGSGLRLLLGEADVAKLSRALAYSRYFQQDRVQRIRTLVGHLNALTAVESDITHKHQALAAALVQNQQAMAQLAAARGRQRTLLAQVNAALKNQHDQMRQLERNRKSLTDLLARLRDVFADIPTTLPADIPFVQRRGKLPWPVQGKVHSHEDGLDIATARGTPVRAVAHGRVAYANWLRGYGLLIIVDHGNGWMSLYGGNETLRAGVGDWVNAGQPIATAGASAGNAAGVYFGLRHDGQPVNPLPWLAKH